MNKKLNFIRLIIADDEKHCRKLVKALLKPHTDIVLIGEAEDGQQLVELTEQLRPDAILVDVEMPVLNGMEAVRLIADKNLMPAVVFITGHSSFAVEAFEMSSCDYVLKPYNEERINKALEKIRTEIDRRRSDSEDQSTFSRLFNKINIRSRGELLFIDMTDILYIESEGRGSLIHCVDGKIYDVNKPLNHIQRKLDSNLFLRAHNGYLINLKHIESIKSWNKGTYVVNFRGTRKEAFISRPKLRELYDILQFYDVLQLEDERENA
jgi:two-component system LytT family response regulator